MFNIVLVAPGDPAQHRQRDPPRRQHRLRAAPRRAARLLDGRQAAAARRARLPRDGPRAAPCVVGRFVSRPRAAAARLFAFTTRGGAPFAEVAWQRGDWLVFGNETRGPAGRPARSLPAAQRVRLPMRAGQRSLNLSNAVAVAVFEAWRQSGYAGAAAPASGLGAALLRLHAGRLDHPGPVRALALHQAGQRLRRRCLQR